LLARLPSKAKIHNPYPAVTIQLPIYNERYVVKRLIDAVCSLDYPKDKLQIQVLDDSTDITKEICRKAVKEKKRQGFDIEYIHRKNRIGFKAGALQNGLRKAKGEFIAIFDADFIPPKEFLKQILQYFTRKDIGMVQARWGHINENYSTLTKAQALDLDLHFIIEQRARSFSELFLNFNGTAGVWRKDCIISCGGWEENLAEDLDLSIRAQLRGWKFVFVPNLICKAELPVQINASKRQRYRWAGGAVQCTLKFFKDIVIAGIPIKTKIQLLIQITRHFIYPLLLTQFILLPILMKLEYNVNPLGALLSQLLLGPAIYLFAIRTYWRKRWLTKLSSYPFLILLAGGMAIVNTKAIIDTLLKKTYVFQRTPKFGEVKGDEWKRKAYVLPFSPTAIVELVFAIYGLLALITAFLTKNFLLTPYIALFTLSFFYVSILTFLHTPYK
jgi:cellulose synthase/poly-beta-1,6-N-acetylglucosamine synthase-like glycosyltransferase